MDDSHGSISGGHVRARAAGARRGPRPAAEGYSFPPGTFFDQQLNTELLTRRNVAEVIAI